jgi:hypothetical protein
VRYVIHLAYLQACMRLGFVLTKVHRVFSYRQEAWLESYISRNTASRARCAESDPMRDVYKLLNNSVFGKLIEAIRDRRDLRLVCSELKAQQLVNNPLYRSHKNYMANDGVHGITTFHLAKSSDSFEQPIAAGQAVLDLSKVIMLEAFVKMKTQFGPSFELLMTDTDSFIFSCDRAALEPGILAAADIMDFSSAPRDSAIYKATCANKGVLGKMKDETAGCEIAEFIGLRPKLYSVLYANGKNTKKAKGVDGRTVKAKISHEDYRAALLGRTDHRVTFTKIGCRNHQLCTQSISKSGLSPLDNKRYVLDDGVNTWPHGYHRLVAGNRD